MISCRSRISLYSGARNESSLSCICTSLSESISFALWSSESWYLRAASSFGGVSARSARGWRGRPASSGHRGGRRTHCNSGSILRNSSGTVSCLASMLIWICTLRVVASRLTTSLTIESEESESERKVASPLAYSHKRSVPRKVERKASEPRSSCNRAGTSGMQAATHECICSAVNPPPIRNVESSGSSVGGAARRVCNDMGLIEWVDTTHVLAPFSGAHTELEPVCHLLATVADEHARPAVGGGRARGDGAVGLVVDHLNRHVALQQYALQRQRQLKRELVARLVGRERPLVLELELRRSNLALRTACVPLTLLGHLRRERVDLGHQLSHPLTALLLAAPASASTCAAARRRLGRARLRRLEAGRRLRRERDDLARVGGDDHLVKAGARDGAACDARDALVQAALEGELWRVAHVKGPHLDQPVLAPHQNVLHAVLGDLAHQPALCPVYDATTRAVGLLVPLDRGRWPVHPHLKHKLAGAQHAHAPVLARESEAQGVGGGKGSSGRLARGRRHGAALGTEGRRRAWQASTASGLVPPESEATSPPVWMVSPSTASERIGSLTLVLKRRNSLPLRVEPRTTVPEE
eukprot:scaffold23271_cov27-Tisochrysis_lutea.AAC.3